MMPRSSASRSRRQAQSEREPSSSTTPCVSSSGAIGLFEQRSISAASTFGTTDSSA
jgi:hypothetical protein